MNRLKGSLAALAMFVGLLGATGTAQADDQYLTFNTFALHFENAADRNSVTPGIGWEYSPSGKIGFHVGTVKDSFNYQAKYVGLNYATPRYAALGGRIRFILGITALHKQYDPNSEPETRVVPLPAIEFQMSEKFVLNVSGSPEIDYQDHHNNAVLIFQGKWNMF